MSNQTKVTDYFVTTKRSDLNVKSFKLKTESTKSEAIVLEKTPKRKQIVIKEKAKSSKKKKTKDKDLISIEFNTNCQTKVVSAVERAETEIEAKVESNEKNNKTLSAEEVKLKLAKCNNLLALKKQLSNINDCAQKVKQFKEMKIKSPVKTIVNRSPSKLSPKRPLIVNSFKTPIKSPVLFTPNHDMISGMNHRRRLFDILDEEKLSPNKNEIKESLHAFQRYDYLLDKQEDSRQTLVLPHKYKVLSEAFRCTDYIVSMLHKRQEMCTFDKLKQSVQGMMRKNFDLKRLAQIQTVFNDAFKLKYELIGSQFDNRKKENNYQLIINPNYNSNIDIKMSSNHLLERHQIFVNKLLDITRDYHNNYLKDLGLDIDPKQLCRWHPKFKLDSVPDIVPNDNALPSEPKPTQRTAELTFESTRQRLGLPSTQTKDETVDNQTVINTPNDRITKGILKGLSMDLLKKIRAKEAANMAQEMTRRPEVEKEIMVLNRLPEFIRIIHSYFIGSYKIAISYDEVINKIAESYHSSIGILEVRQTVDYLTNFFNEWIYLLEVKKGSYLKINKNITISSLEQRIVQRVKQLKN